MPCDLTCRGREMLGGADIRQRLRRAAVKQPESGRTGRLQYHGPQLVVAEVIARATVEAGGSPVHQAPSEELFERPYGHLLVASCRPVQRVELEGVPSDGGGGQYLSRALAHPAHPGDENVSHSLGDGRGYVALGQLRQILADKQRNALALLEEPARQIGHSLLVGSYRFDNLPDVILSETLQPDLVESAETPRATRQLPERLGGGGLFLSPCQSH